MKRERKRKKLKNPNYTMSNWKASGKEVFLKAILGGKANRMGSRGLQRLFERQKTPRKEKRGGSYTC